MVTTITKTPNKISEYMGMYSTTVAGAKVKHEPHHTHTHTLQTCMHTLTPTHMHTQNTWNHNTEGQYLQQEKMAPRFTCNGTMMTHSRLLLREPQVLSPATASMMATLDRGCTSRERRELLSASLYQGQSMERCTKRPPSLHL